MNLEQELKKIYEKYTSITQKVYNIFCNYYEEENVDIQHVLSFEDFGENVLGIKLGSIITDEGKTKLNNLFSYETDTKKLKEKIDSYLNYTLAQLYSENSENIEIPGIKAFDDIDINKLFECLNTFDILIHFPKVRVTNEYNDYIDITHLYAKVTVRGDGSYLRTTCLRSEYTESQYIYGYIHSHVEGLNQTYVGSFNKCCFGGGPLRGIIANLSVEYDDTLWELFCYEFDRFTQTESIKGVPYKHLQNVTSLSYRKHEVEFNYVCNNHILIIRDEYNNNILIPFIKDFISSNKLKFNFCNDSYGIAMSPLDYMILVSNFYIEWLNDKISKKEITSPELIRTAKDKLEEYVIDDKIYKIERIAEREEISRNDFLFTFKGNPVHLNIVKAEESETLYTTLLLTGHIAFNIADLILKTLNYKNCYGTKTNKITYFL